MLSELLIFTLPNTWGGAISEPDEAERSRTKSDIRQEIVSVLFYLYLPRAPSILARTVGGESRHNQCALNFDTLSVRFPGTISVH